MNLRSKLTVAFSVILLTPSLGLNGIIPKIYAIKSISQPLDTLSSEQEPPSTVIRSRSPSLIQSENDSGLWEALSNDNHQQVRLFLDEGANLSTFEADERFEAITFAISKHRDAIDYNIRNDYINVVRAILNAETTSPTYINNAIDNLGNTLLHWTAHFGYLDVEDLLNKGADPTIRNHWGYTPFGWAVIKNNINTAKALNKNEKNEENENIILLMEEINKLYLHEDAGKTDINVVRVLLRRQGVYLSKFADYTLMGILYLAVINGDFDLANSILRVDRRHNIVNSTELDCSPLTCAITTKKMTTKQKLDMVRMLLCNYADPKKFIDHSHNPLYHAIIFGDDDIINLLIKYGANINYTNYPSPSHSTLLHLAAYKGIEPKYFQKMFELGIKHVNTKDPFDNYTPLHKLVEGATYNDKSYDLDIIHELALLLLEHGANPYIVDKGGRTPMELARALGKNDIANTLIQAIKDNEAKK